MSVVARQGFKYSLIGYFGFLIGTLSALFIFPADMNFYGKLRFIMPTAEMLLPIVVFGISFSNVKFFNLAKTAGKHQNMLTLSIAAVFMNFILFLAGFYVFFSIFPTTKNLEIWKMKGLILPLILILSLSSVFNKYISNFKRIVIPNIFENLFPKLANLGAFVLFFFLGVSEKGAYGFFFGMFFFALCGYAFYANRLERFHPDFSTAFFLKNGLYKEIFSYSFYGFLGNIGSYIAFRVDNFMITEALNFEQNGIYSTALNILSLITIPQMGLYNISAPIINKSIENQDFKELDLYHKKTSLSLFFLGSVLFACIVTGFPFLTEIMPKNGQQLAASVPVIWILGTTTLFDLATGFNGHIISLSRYYRFNIMVMLLLAAMTIILNFIFLKTTTLGIIGVALATAISLTVFNFLKIAFNYKKFAVFPLTKKMIHTIFSCGLAIIIAFICPNFNNSFINLIYKPTITLGIILFFNYFFKIYHLKAFLNKNFLKSIFKVK